MKPLFTLVCAMLFLFFAAAQKPVQLTSPNGQLRFSISLKKGAVQYSVSFKNKALIAGSPLRLQFSDGGFQNLIMARPVFSDTTESYELVVGKTKNVTTHYKTMTIPLQEKTKPFRKLHLVVKAFDDGLAFRYEMPQQPSWKSYELLDESTTFNITGNPLVRALFLPNYTSSHEGLYTTKPLQQLYSDSLMAVPALFEFPDTVFLAITEAALLDYAGMYLMKKGNALVSGLSPLPAASGIKVKASLPHQSPWRVLLVSNRMGALIESNILTTLNAPSKTADWSWIKPGKTTFPWWNGNVVPDTLNAPGNNFVTAQYYIDFCARNGIEYHSVVEYGLHQWYVDNGVGFQPGPNADVTRPVPGLDMKEICDYAATKGVGVRVWVHWAALYPKLDAAFALFEKWGLKGMMIDFMDRDDQEMVNMQTEMLEKAAKHKLHIQFHGAYKPTGLHRTYPNEFTREGTLNYETNKWNSGGLSPDHDINIPFTRMLAGATDYHMGGFRAVPQTLFKAQYTKPLMLGTRCHQLAMNVVLESYLGMVCDFPDAYEGQEGFDFVKAVPTTWDETIVPVAAPGKYIAIARRTGQDWFIGAITNGEGRELTISLRFLPEGTYEATIYSDAEDVAKNPNKLKKDVRTLTRNDVLQLTLAAGGGAAIQLKKR